MPNVTLHLVLADRVLQAWQEEPRGAPFPLEDPTAVNAFRQGAFGPDLGYFPGGYRPLSELAHTRRSADLSRSLIRRAATDRERAFAWGWVTHVLADQAIHPWVGRGVGELRTGRRDVFVSGDQDPGGHVRVETGIDAWYAVRHPEVRCCRPDPVFDGGTIRFLVDAYHETYSLHIDPALLLTSHIAATRMSGRALRTMGVLGSALRWEEGEVAPVCWARRGLEGFRRGLQRATGRESLLLSLLSPVAPARWLLAEVEALVSAFAPHFLAHYRSEGSELENRNLDTGELDAPSPLPYQPPVSRAAFGSGKVSPVGVLGGDRVRPIPATDADHRVEAVA